MKEISIKNNDTSLKIYINDFPNLTLISKDKFELLIAGIELQMFEYFRKKHKNLSK